MKSDGTPPARLRIAPYATGKAMRRDEVQLGVPAGKGDVL